MNEQKEYIIMVPFLQYVIATLLLALAGGLVFYNMIPLAFHDKSLRKDLAKLKSYIAHRWAHMTRYTMELGGYVHDTAMALYIPPTIMHFVTGTWTWAAGQVAGTIVAIKAAAAETTTIHVPIIIPGNSVALKGSMINSIELDYEIRTSAATSVTLTLSKITRGADGADAVVTSVTGTQLLTAATTAATVDEHKDKFTVTTPAYIDNDEYYLLKVVAVCAAGTVLEILGATVNYTFRA